MLGFLGFFSPFLFPSEQAEKPFQVTAGIICSLVIVSMRIGLRACGSTRKQKKTPCCCLIFLLTCILEKEEAQEELFQSNFSCKQKSHLCGGGGVNQ